MSTGFDINGRFFPAVEAFTLGDPVLIRDLTGLDFPSFAEAYDDLMSEVAMAKDGEADVDPIVLIGLVGVSVWHDQPTWRRDKVVKFVQALSMDSIKFVGGEDQEEDDDGPPAGSPADSLSGGTPAGSSSSAGEIANQNGSGDLTLPAGAASQ